ncbi:MAG: putative endonuclease [Patescibacteria group bacterium]|nr:YraN family protein [Candidatus Saccharibacteria bacterium]MDQ5962962.1 putative endonuclease [Patescibacteria group bacterium]
MTNHSSGHHAEQVAAEYLKAHDYTIVDINWKSRMAEIDIVAKNKGDALVFFEVKYRSSSWQGSGLDYITPAKFNQMQRAANAWVQANGFRGEYSLGAVEVSGDEYTVTAVLDELL